MSERPQPIRISPERAKELLDREEGVVLDVVDTHAYQEVRFKIPGAVRIEPERIPEEYQSLPRDRAVLAYWTWPNEETSASVAFFMRKKGYQAYAIRGGLEGWHEAGFELERKEG